MDGYWKVDVPDLEPARENLCNRTSVSEEQNRLVTVDHVFHNPQPRRNLRMSEELHGQLIILARHLWGSDLQPHLTGNRHVDHFDRSALADQKLGNDLGRTDRRREPYHLEFSLCNPAQSF